MTTEANPDSSTGPTTFFLSYGESVKKVKASLGSLEDLFGHFKEKFPDAKKKDGSNIETRDVDFQVKDRQFDVEVTLDAITDIYEGAVMKVKVKGEAATSKALKRQLDEMKQKLNELEKGTSESRSKRQRTSLDGQPSTASSHQERKESKWANAHAVRVRGLPWGYKKEDIETFFEGLKLEAILAVLDKFGRESGEAYVVFPDEKSVEEAKLKHKEKMQHRYIEIYKVTNGSELVLASRNTRNLMGDGEDEIVLRLRGLPWQCTERMIEDFFEKFELGGVHLTHDSTGRFKGECLVMFKSAADAQEAKKKDRETIGHRYVEIYVSSLAEWDAQTGAVARQTSYAGRSGLTFVARMRGLPFSARESDIFDFFNGINIMQVHLAVKEDGRMTGEGFVEVATSDELGRCLQKNRERIGHRYVEIFRSNHDELAQVMGLGRPAASTPSPAQQLAAQQYVGETFCLKMRGLPFNATEDMITDFFKMAHVTPIRIHRKNDGGEAFVEFQTQQEQRAAQSLHKEHIGRRYIELFSVSYEEVAKIVGLPLDPYQDPNYAAAAAAAAAPYAAYGHPGVAGPAVADPYAAAAYAEYYANYPATVPGPHDAKAGLPHPTAYAGYDAKVADPYAAQSAAGVGAARSGAYPAHGTAAPSYNQYKQY